MKERKRENKREMSYIDLWRTVLIVLTYREPGKGMQNIAKQHPSRDRKKS